jgi:hypothetical protein
MNRSRNKRKKINSQREEQNQTNMRADVWENSGSDI